MTKKISTLEAVFITLMAATGIALKPVIGPIGKIIGSFFLIPGGVIVGAIYMMWPMLAKLVVRYMFTATFVGLIQGIIVLITGIYGSHGILSLVTYVLPCIIIDISYMLFSKINLRVAEYVSTGLGNATGHLVVSFIIMHLPTTPLLISMIPAFIFGGFGGVLAKKIYIPFVKAFPQFSAKEVQRSIPLRRDQS